jgi:hypothetical protein
MTSTSPKPKPRPNPKPNPTPCPKPKPNPSGTTRHPSSPPTSAASSSPDSWEQVSPPSAASSPPASTGASSTWTPTSSRAREGQANFWLHSATWLRLRAVLCLVFGAEMPQGDGSLHHVEVQRPDQHLGKEVLKWHGPCSERASFQHLAHHHARRSRSCSSQGGQPRVNGPICPKGRSGYLGWPHS